MPAAILIVNYKSYGELKSCLASLVPHLSADDEIVVVDYESDARALDAAIDVGRRMTTVRRADDLGFAAGVNMAAACAVDALLDVDWVSCACLMTRRSLFDKVGGGEKKP